MLELDHVTIAYGETQAVEDFSLHMEPGEIVSLVGESGSGKTSVIRGILGLLPGGGAVTQGNIVYYPGAVAHRPRAGDFHDFSGQRGHDESYPQNRCRFCGVSANP